MKIAHKALILLSGGSNYTPLQQHILSIKPAGLIFLGPLNETLGTNANDLSAQNNDGAYSRAGMLADGTFLTGEPCPLWVPASSDNLALPAGFNSDYNLNEFCVVVWGKVSAAGIWTDTTARILFEANQDAQNRTTINKSGTNNTLTFRNIANNTAKIVNHTISTTDWFMATIKNSRSSGADGEMKAFVNDAQTGSTQTALGTAGTVTVANSRIGDLFGTNTWDGLIAYGAVWAGAGNLPSDAEITGIYDFLVP